MEEKELFGKLWAQYAETNPSVQRIHDLFATHGEKVVDDHVAFRTFDDPRIGMDVLARPFLGLGYVPRGTYQFQEKKLRARHYEKPGEPGAPRIFISELMLDRFSKKLQSTVRGLIDRLPAETLQAPDLILKGSIFNPVSHSQYSRLREESEYAAWVYVFGYRANHFTISINHLKKYKTIQEVNTFLKEHGFNLNSSGGEVKGSPGQLLEQSSTLADKVEIAFQEGIFSTPSCYYEFARRYPDKNGNLFNGFIAGSADKIFESTDFRT